MEHETIEVVESVNELMIRNGLTYLPTSLHATTSEHKYAEEAWESGKWHGCYALFVWLHPVPAKNHNQHKHKTKPPQHQQG